MSSIQPIKNFFIDRHTDEFTEKGFAVLGSVAAIGLMILVIGVGFLAAKHNASSSFHTLQPLGKGHSILPLNKPVTGETAAIGVGTTLFLGGAGITMALMYREPKKRITLESIDKLTEQELKETGFNEFNSDELNKHLA